MARYDLSEVEWSIIEPLLPPAPPGKQRVDDRRVLNGIFWVLRTGSPWRDLPARYGPSTTVYNRFNRWAKRGVWLAVFEALAREEPAALQLDDRAQAQRLDHGETEDQGDKSHEQQPDAPVAAPPAVMQFMFDTHGHVSLCPDQPRQDLPGTAPGT